MREESKLREAVPLRPPLLLRLVLLQLLLALHPHASGSGAESESECPSSAESAERLPALLVWVQRHGGWLHPSLELREGRHGAGVFAIAPVHSGEALVRTPRVLTISGDSVLAHSRGESASGGGERAASGSPPPPIAGAVARLLAKNQTSEAISLFVAQQRSHSRFLAAETHWQPAQQQPSGAAAAAAARRSHLRPFISSMPAAVANALAFSAAEVDALRGSAAESAARAMQQSAARHYAHLCLAEPELFGQPEEPEPEAEAEAGGGGKRRPLEGQRIEAEDMLWATSMV